MRRRRSQLSKIISTNSEVNRVRNERKYRIQQRTVRERDGLNVQRAMLWSLGRIQFRESNQWCGLEIFGLFKVIRYLQLNTEILAGAENLADCFVFSRTSRIGTQDQYTALILIACNLFIKQWNV